MSLLNNHLKGKDKKKAAPGKTGFAANPKVKANTKAAHAAPKQTGGSQRGS